jgi:paraquat-inducible protein A
VLGALRADRRPPWLGRVFRWAVWLDRWAMLDVFLLAIIERIQVSLKVGGACLVAAGIVTVLSRATLDERTVWRAIGGETYALSRCERLMACRTCDLVQPLSPGGQNVPSLRRADFRKKARRGNLHGGIAGHFVRPALSSQHLPNEHLDDARA